MPWESLAIGVALSLLSGMGIWSCAYRLGLRKGRTVAIPFQLIDELLDHRISCLGQGPALARLEIGNLLGIEEWQSQNTKDEPPAHEHDIAAAHVYH
ncbi:MAG: hypothetical protein FJ147_15110 [Deltaproteobacteria bacterium]|nr:hypothetical protein [Deltaproteobacteria bacterium]